MLEKVQTLVPEWIPSEVPEWVPLWAHKWLKEIGMLSLMIVYFAFYAYGRTRNRKLAEQYVSGANSVAKTLFAVTGCAVRKPLVKDSDCRYTTYASGRRGTESMLTRLRLFDRTNIVYLLASKVFPSLFEEDTVLIEITPTQPEKIDNGVFAVANFEYWPYDPYFLKHAKPLTKTTTNSCRLVGEHSDQVELLYTKELQEAVAKPGTAKVLRYLAFSDLPVEEPEKEEELNGAKRVWLKMKLPRTYEEREAASSLIKSAVHLVDTLLAKPPYRNSTKRKIEQVRDGIKQRLRAAVEAEQREQLEAERAKKRREEARQLEKLSPEEQRQRQKREQEKRNRRNRNKMTARIR